MVTKWTREETIIAFNMYCKIPFKDSNYTHPMIVKYAKIIGRSPSALKTIKDDFLKFFIDEIQVCQEAIMSLSSFLLFVKNPLHKVGCGEGDSPCVVSRVFVLHKVSVASVALQLIVVVAYH